MSSALDAVAQCSRISTSVLYWTFVLNLIALPLQLWQQPPVMLQPSPRARAISWGCKGCSAQFGLRMLWETLCRTLLWNLLRAEACIQEKLHSSATYQVNYYELLVVCSLTYFLHHTSNLIQWQTWNFCAHDRSVPSLCLCIVVTMRSKLMYLSFAQQWIWWHVHCIHPLLTVYGEVSFILYCDQCPQTGCRSKSFLLPLAWSMDLVSNSVRYSPTRLYSTMLPVLSLSLGQPSDHVIFSLVSSSATRAESHYSKWIILLL